MAASPTSGALCRMTSIDLLKLLPHSASEDDRKSPTAFFWTHVPWVAPLAYLHVIFKPIEQILLEPTISGCGMPFSYTSFLQLPNGAILFSGALSIYGVHPAGQLLNREDPLLQLPFNVEVENSNWPPANRHRFLTIGGYGFDGSRACIDREDLRIYLFKREINGLSKDPLLVWEDLETWIIGEIDRLSTMFDTRGRRLVEDERLTLPHAGSNA